MRKTLICIIAAICTLAAHAGQGIVGRQGTLLVRDGKPYNFVGANMWYGAILGSTGQGGNRELLRRELDTLKALGVTNLRVLAGADGDESLPFKAEPALQTAPGVYNDTILDGLDYMLAEMGKRGMTAVVYLNNSWEWSGGYTYYLKQAGAGEPKYPETHSYGEYVDYAAKFATDTAAQRLFMDHVAFMVGRTNRHTGKAYKDDPAIMSWQVGNEPRAFSKAALPHFAKWLSQATALIRSIDPNHLISLGSEGSVGCENDMEYYKAVCSDPNVDYLNIHIWPSNWGWVRKTEPEADLQNGIRQSLQYIGEHRAVAGQLGKPLVIEEFGYPRDGASYSLESTTEHRDEYYRAVMGEVEKDVRNGGPIRGCNFWAWSGFCRPAHERWQSGDDFAGDPPQEPQGLFSTFISDSSTISVIKEFSAKIKAGE